MDLDYLISHIKPLDFSAEPVTSAAEADYFAYYGIDFENRFDDVSHHFGFLNCGRHDIVCHYFSKHNATATCFLFHGYFDHSGLFGKLIDYCLSRNFSVVIYDLPGHGLSTGEPASISDFAVYESVMRDVLAHFSDVAPKPWNAMAQSTGAAILMDYILTQGEHLFSRMVLLAPLVRPAKWRRSVMLYSLAKIFLKQMPRDFLESSNDAGFLDFIKNVDPLQSRFLPLSWVGALKQWIARFLHYPSSDSELLVIQGEDDFTVDWRYNLSVIKEKLPKAKVFRIKEARHHLVNESEKIRGPIMVAMDLYLKTEPGSE